MSQDNPRRAPLRPPPNTKLGELENSGWNIVGAAIQMSSRLRDHIERLDNGASYAVDDLAVVLRALVCSGDGNRVLMRMCNSVGCPIPPVLLSREAPAESDIFFAVGSIPAKENVARLDGATEVSVTKWMTLRVLTVQSSGSRVTYTWDRFLSTYAEKWGGAHLDPAVPAHLRMIDKHAAGGMPLSNYLIRTAAVQVWNVTQDVYRHIFARVRLGDESPESRVGAIFVAQGGIATEPRTISDRGLLQAFCHRTGGADLLWYVDEASPDNALHLELGTVPYDVRYESQKVAATKGRVEVQAQRRQDSSSPITLSASSVKTISLNGQVRTLTEITNNTRSETDTPSENVGPQAAGGSGEDR